MKRTTFASLPGLAALTYALTTMGAICPRCGHGTRVTSKNWARCKKCGARIPRGKGAA